MPRQVGAEQEPLCGYNKFSLLPITLNNYLGREFLAVAQEQPLSQQMKYCHCNEHFSQRQLRKEKGNPCLITSLFAKNIFCLILKIFWWCAGGGSGSGRHQQLRGGILHLCVPAGRGLGGPHVRLHREEDQPEEARGRGRGCSLHIRWTLYCYMCCGYPTQCSGCFSLYHSLRSSFSTNNLYIL